MKRVGDQLDELVIVKAHAVIGHCARNADFFKSNIYFSAI